MADAGMLVCDLPRNSKEQPDGPAAPVNTNPPAPIENPLLKEKQSPTVLLRDSELNETQIREGFEAVQKASAHTNLSYDEMTTLHNSVQENLNDPSVSIEPLEIFKKRKEVNSEEK